ncbi:MAG: TonB-dependent receptor plug domain-containing protein [Bacteroidetes bacterium]|nr:TonB-dependent receptor plug domain-containing protein [Bacteroidota bacterium]
METRPFLPFACGLFLTVTLMMAAAPPVYCQEDSTKVSHERLVSPVFPSGTITREPSYTISDSEIIWSDYRYSGEILQRIPGSFLANMDQPGDPSELYFDGLGADHTKYLLDGVELNEPTTSSLNLYHVPMEFVGNVQYIDALRAPIYQFNATGGLVNFQTHQYSEPVPYSKVRHMEEPYNYLITDGVFSQNIGYNSNIDAGFERQTTDGRFDNAVYDGVNIRAKYRYSIDSTRQLTATEVYYRTKGGANGGALPYNINANIFQQFLIPLRSTTANLTYLQHHVQAAYSQGDPYDSTQFLTASVFYDYYSFQYGDASFYLANISRRVGANVRGSENFAFGRLNFGAEAVRDENPYNSHAVIPSQNRISGYADEEFHLFDLVSAGVFGRGDIVSDTFYPAFGFLFGFRNEYFGLEAGANISDQVPSLSEKYFVSQSFTGNTNLKAETDKLLQLKAGVRLGETLEFSLKPYMRLIDNPIYFREQYVGQPAYPNISVVNLSTRKIYGVDAAIKLTLWKFGADGNFNYVSEKIDGAGVNTLPKYYAAGELYYHDILFNGHLNLRAGVRGRVLSEFQGSGFYPEALIYYPTDLNQYGPYGSSDLFVQARIGSAVIYFTFFNLTGEDYFVAPVYPALNSSFGFGINWEFLN